MSFDQISALIDAKIRCHEIRVGIVSGIIGVLWLGLQVCMMILCLQVAAS